MHKKNQKTKLNLELNQIEPKKYVRDKPIVI